MERKLSASFVNKTFQQQLSPGQLQESKLGGISPSQQVWQQLCRSGLQSIPRHFIRRGGAHHKVKGEKKLQILPSFLPSDLFNVDAQEKRQGLQPHLHVGAILRHFVTSRSA